MKKLLFFLFVSSILSCHVLYAQNKFHPWGIGVSYNVSNMEGLFNQKFFKARNYSGGIKLQVARYLSPSFNARLEGTYGSIYYPMVSNYPNRIGGFYNQQNFFEASYLFEYKLNNNYVFKENAYIQPYLFIGFGTNNMNKDWNTFFPWGAGFKIKCTKWLAVNLETTFKVNIDNSYNYLQHNAGLIFSLGKAVSKANTNAVSDNKKIKNDLKDLEVNNNLDSDKDGVIDANDECPFLYGISNLNGCPDTDLDGIADSKDQCPNEKGSNENNGCPIIIIDTDKDGIADKDDQCPYEKGTATNFGCPEKIISEPIKETTSSISTKENIVITNNTTNYNNKIELFYPMSSSVLTDEHKKQLDEFISKLNTPYKSIKINGYTSNSGNDDLNIKLSMNRAINIMNYIASKGISQRLINTYGYGAYNAKYSNAIPEESIKNQRVEIIIE